MDKQKQIEEMAKIIHGYCKASCPNAGCQNCFEYKKAEALYNADHRKVVMCKDCAYCEEHHYEVEGERPYVKLTCKWNSYSHDPNGYCSVGKMKGE